MDYKIIDITFVYKQLTVSYVMYSYWKQPCQKFNLTPFPHQVDDPEQESE